MAKSVAICVMAVAIGFALSFAVLVWSDDRSKPTIIIEDPRPDATIVVSVEGAVATPGLYALQGDARVQDALDAAGGPASDADLARINPAARLKDEERLVIPRSGGASLTTQESGTTAAETPATSGVGLININTADAELLETLPGIGPVLAEAIVAHREANGPFALVDELAEVKGISLKMVDELRSLVTV